MLMQKELFLSIFLSPTYQKEMDAVILTSHDIYKTSTTTAGREIE